MYVVSGGVNVVYVVDMLRYFRASSFCLAQV